MALLRRCDAKLRLKVNEAKSAVASVTGHKFLGYSFWFAKEGVKRRVAAKPLSTFRQRVRQLTRRSGGRSMAEVIERLRPYLLGWKAYFGLAQTPGVWRMLDEWLRHRLWAIQLKHWKRGKTMYRKLLDLGAAEPAARRVAANSRCWWRNSNGDIKRVLTSIVLAYPVSHDLNFSNRPVRTRMPGGVAGVQPMRAVSYADFRVSKNTGVRPVGENGFSRVVWHSLIPN